MSIRLSQTLRSRHIPMSSQQATLGRQVNLTAKERDLRSFLLNVAEYIGSHEEYAKPELRFTGGWVRDKLLGSPSHDIDVGISSLTGEKFGALMKKYLLDPEIRSSHPENILGTLSVIKENPERSKHLETARAKIYGIEVDLVNLRKETYSNESRNPVVEFGTPEEDAFRRDATVNALFYNLSSNEVEDLTGQGLRDMELKVIRTPMEPFQTFKDDPLRILRCIRFASRLSYRIHSETLHSMNNSEILDSLRLKISRERIGEEISKMLKGPDPQMALSMIDSLGLFNVIFTDPYEAFTVSTDTSGWHRAVETVSRICNGDESPLKNLRALLIANRTEAYLAWLMAAVVPLAGCTLTPSNKPGKLTTTGAAYVAREALKLDNVATNIINDAVANLNDIHRTKDEFLKSQSNTKELHKKGSDIIADDREKFGMAIRRWSPRKSSNWRLSALFGLLDEQLGAKTPHDGVEIIRNYESWLAFLKDLGLLDAHEMRPILNGNDVMEAVGRSSGPWLSEALDAVIRWQLRNPESTDADGARAEIIDKYKL